MGEAGETRAKDSVQGKEQQLLQAGLAHHRAGRLPEAVDCYASLLGIQPEHADALNLLGVVARQRDDLTASERLIRQAIAQKSDVATYHHHLAKTYALQGKVQEAAQSYRRALSLNPRDVDSMQLLAALLGEVGIWDEAVGLYEQLVQLEPHKAEWWYRVGQSLKGQGRLDEALAFYRHAIELFPDSTDGYFNLGKALFETGERLECLQCFRRVVAMHPEDAEAHNWIGQILHEVGELGPARHAYLEAIKLKPAFVEALSNLGALLMEIAEFDVSEALLRRVLQLAPGFACASSNLGAVLAKQGRFIEALEIFRQILLKNPIDSPTLCSMGFSLDALGDLEGARECFQLALKAEPNSALAQFNLSSHLLLDGNFAAGWLWYERRWDVRQFSGMLRPHPQPRWHGEEIAGRSIYLFAEQGFGDTLHFVRYALLLVERGAQVFLEVQASLVPLLRTLNPELHVSTYGKEEIPLTDWHCPLLSLPKIFGTDLSNIPAAVPYVHPDKGKVKQWAERILGPELRVGVVWSGNPEHTRDRLRSVPIKEFYSVLRTPHVSFYSLQKGAAATQARTLTAEIRITDLEPYLLDFSDTAAIIANLDLVITVDTAVAHLAAAMGKPVWIILAHAPDWRWLRERTDSPWYPTARLFRQRSSGDWFDVLEQVKNALCNLVGRT